MTITDPAKFNRWISIVSDQQTPGAGGIIENDSITIWEGWAAIWPASAKETRENMRMGATITHNIRIYYRPGILHNMRVVYGSRNFDIKGIINPDESDFYLDLVCEEKL